MYNLFAFDVKEMHIQKIEVEFQKKKEKLSRAEIQRKKHGSDWLKSTVDSNYFCQTKNKSQN